MKDPNVYIVIVTYSSADVLGECLERIKCQKYQNYSVTVVDSGSPDTEYLELLSHKYSFRLIEMNENVGFCVANNFGYKSIDGEAFEYVLFLNPDAFLSESTLADCVEFMTEQKNTAVGAITVPILGWSLKKKSPTGKVDSLGIGCTWYGKWYDIAQGKLAPPAGILESARDVPALCGAFIFARTTAINSVLYANGDVFPAAYFMYKEDICLSLRLKRLNWELKLIDKSPTYHCRGWARQRSKIPKKYRVMSALNDLRIATSFKWSNVPFSLLKLMYAVFVEAN